MASLHRGPGWRTSEPKDDRRALIEQLEERTAQLELAVGAGRRLRREYRAEVKGLRRELEALRERLVRAEEELENARAKLAEAPGRRDLTGWIRGRLRA